MTPLVEPRHGPQGHPQTEICPAIPREKVAGNVNLEQAGSGVSSLGSSCREKEDVEMVEKGGVLYWRQRKNGQRGRRKPGVAGVTEAKEERVSRNKGWSVTVQPLQKVDQSIRMDGRASGP